MSKTKTLDNIGKEIAIASGSKLATIKKTLQSGAMMQALADAVPVTARQYLTPERIVRIVTTALSRNPRLIECEHTSVLRAVVDLVQLGLEPGGPLGHGYLVPFRNGKTGQMECQPIVGYQGYLAIARRSGEIESITAEIICENDEYDIQFGDDPKLMHRRKLTGERGEPIAVYCVAKFRGGGKHIELMTRDEVAAIRKRSKSADFGPWVTDPDMMARKTVIKRARHYWPMSVEMASAAELDDNVDSGYYNNLSGTTAPIKALPEGAHKIGDIPQPADNEPGSPGVDFGPPPLSDEELAELESVASQRPIEVSE